jgi:hypothetical protein
MKINEIIVEAIDQKEADDVLRSLVASGDPAARYFQQTRYNSIHTTIDSAQRAAERMAKAAADRQSARTAASTAKNAAPAPATLAKPSAKPAEKLPKDYGDSFYGNQYTGSLGRGARLGDVDLGIDFDQKGLKTIGKTIDIAKSAAKPFSNLATAFKAGMNKAPGKR